MLQIQAIILHMGKLELKKISNRSNTRVNPRINNGLGVMCQCSLAAYNPVRPSAGGCQLWGSLSSVGAGNIQEICIFLLILLGT